jgi:NADH-ubiquinone oxidoreductase chain 6
MENLFILKETFTNGLSYSLLHIISILSGLCGILVIISKNPIVSVLFLIGLFLNIAGYLMMLGINFIGLSYLLVYVGAVSILFLFILMLINVRISELVTDNNNSVPLAAMIGIIFNITLFKLLPTNFIAKGYVYNLGLLNTFINTSQTQRDNVNLSAHYGLDISISEQSSVYNEDLYFVASNL